MEKPGLRRSIGAEAEVLQAVSIIAVLSVAVDFCLLDAAKAAKRLAAGVLGDMPFRRFSSIAISMCERILRPSRLRDDGGGRGQRDVEETCDRVRAWARSSLAPGDHGDMRSQLPLPARPLASGVGQGVVLRLALFSETPHLEAIQPRCSMRSRADTEFPGSIAAAYRDLLDAQGDSEAVHWPHRIESSAPANRVFLAGLPIWKGIPPLDGHRKKGAYQIPVGRNRSLV